MKKLFVILLAVTLVLSLSVLASAATFSPYVGGEFQLTYTSKTGNGTSPFDLGSGNNSMIKAYVQGKVEDADTNTWAQIGIKMTCWSNTNTIDPTATSPITDSNYDLLYSAGIRKVGGIVDIQFSTDDYEATLRGQTPLNNGAYRFGGDPFFTNRLANSFGIDVNADNVTVNVGVTSGLRAGSTVINELGKQIVAAATFKMDAGKVYAGYASLGTNNSNMIVGAEMKLGFGTLKADYYSANTGSTNSVFQANVGFDEAKVNATLYYTMPAVGNSVIGVGAEYSGVDKITLGAKYFNTTDARYEVYGVIKAGVFDFRPGYADDGAGDGYFYLALHAGMW